jgi:hypothetical protein
LRIVSSQSGRLDSEGASSRRCNADMLIPKENRYVYVPLWLPFGVNI